MLSIEVSIYILGNNFDDIAIQVVVATMEWTLEHLNSCQLVCSTLSCRVDPSSRAEPTEPLRI